MNPASRFAQYVGRRSAPLIVEVERGHIRRFAEAIGDPNPIYFDEAAARAAGHPTVVAPPTFATALRANDPREGIELDWRKLLHGEQSFRSARPLYAGDRLTLSAAIVDADLKTTRSGEMDVMVLATTADDAAGQRVFTATASILVRR